MNPIAVSICMITYNHENFIRRALDSIIEQKCNFQYDIVIGDDLSSDCTRHILLEFKNKYPERIKLLLREKNIGVSCNFADTIFECSGKYIAVLEGDDYWTDPYKLQKQYDLLEANHESTLCYTNCKEVNEITNTSQIVCENRPQKIDLNYLLSEGWFMRTPTLFFRNRIINKFPDWFYTAYSTDYILQVLLLQKGNALKINEVTAVYRKHPNGISVVDTIKQLDMWNEKLKLLKIISNYLNEKYKNEVNQQSSTIYFRIFKFSLKNKVYSKIFLNSLFRSNVVRNLFKFITQK